METLFYMLTVIAIVLGIPLLGVFLNKNKGGEGK
jgi:hypothetical protein